MDTLQDSERAKARSTLLSLSLAHPSPTLRPLSVSTLALRSRSALTGDSPLSLLYAPYAYDSLCDLLFCSISPSPPPRRPLSCLASNIQSVFKLHVRTVTLLREYKIVVGSGGTSPNRALRLICSIPALPVLLHHLLPAALLALLPSSTPQHVPQHPTSYVV